MRIKKYLSFLLVLVLVTSGIVSYAAPREADDLLDGFKEVNMFPKEPDKIDVVTYDDIYKDNDYVRIIVQLKDEPAISYSQRNVRKYSELSSDRKLKLEGTVLDSQRTLQNELSEQGIYLDTINNMTVAVNAFSSMAKVEEIEKIKANPRVKDVYIANEYFRPENPEMITSNDMIGSYYIWDNLGYKGEGMVVAIIDTGIDPSHKDMKISEGVEAKLDERFVNAQKLPGKYFTEKVPYGYNYFDRNQTILNVDPSSHGMHVAGTVGANGEIKGVAPEAQLLAMKVFSNDPDFPSTYDDIYMKAIDDAIKLGVDVINMSIGSPAGFYIPNSAMDEIITNARKHGVVFSISAGNAAHSTDGYIHGYPYRENPDIGMVGSPSLNKDSISVASIENTHSQTNYIAYGENGKAQYVLAGSIPLAGIFDGPVEFVDVGFGYPEDYEGKDLNGKVALISRGQIDFVSKIMNAQNAGAAVAIVYNNAGDDLISMVYPDEGKIPAAFIGNTSGKELKSLEVKEMSFPKDLLSVPNPNAWEMADSTSWGTTPTLDMKPEITAPGAKIYSTLENDNYGIMSGTSMAAPHVSGGTALVLQRLKKEFPNMSYEELSEFSKILLMNTAKPVKDRYEYPYSPRRQGAGLMNLTGALTTPVTVVNKADGEAKVQLRDFDSKVFSINLLATNHSDRTVDYDIEVDVLGEWIHPQGLSFLDVAPLIGAKVTGDTSVTLNAGETKEISLKVDISNAKVPGIETPIEPNMFVEGFVRLVAPTQVAVDEVEEELYPSLVVPYVGFYGDWYGENSPRILDGMPRFGEESYYGYAGIVNQNGQYMGFDPVNGFSNSIDRLAISPDSKEEEANTHIIPVLSFMRNAEEIQFNVVDGSGRQIRRIKTESWVRKTYYNAQNIWFSYVSNRGWDGKANGKIVEDGLYFYEIKAKPQNGDWQVYRYPVHVDTVAPEILNLKYKDSKLTWEASDRGIGISHFTIYVGDKELEVVIPTIDGKYQLEIEVPEETEITLLAQDYAGNVSRATVKSTIGQKPSITFETPQPFDLYKTNSITIKGSVKAEEGLKSLIAYITPDGIEEDTLEVNIDINDEGQFNKVVENLEDAVYYIRLVAIDNADQNSEIFRYFHIDTTAPVIKNVQVEIEESDGETIDKQMPNGGVAIVIPHLQEAYHRDYITKNTVAKNKFNQAIASGKDVYVKLANNVFVNYEGKLVTQDNVPALTYYNSQGFVEKYDENGNYIVTATKIAKFRLEVEENHGYFEVYVNGSQEYIQKEYGLIERKPFDGTIEFSIEVADSITEFEIVIEDNVGNKVSEKVGLDLAKR
ncbi:lactocepin [Proteiniborus sp. DW1]|uniref:S8 family serine peptidase n=1 Tax=Proteiniborus sp. DW1 TaxID=1889883 RepID=UPI00092E0BF6|nr:S8 family serine peptidase [Proteiniborus sp. DW1]SCG81813.1 lactocepin [Proteiniborus sp. DW1]